MIEIKKDCHGVKLIPRGKDYSDPHVCIQLLTEDDEMWFDCGQPFSAAWLDELIELLTETRALLKSDVFEKEPICGYRFKPFGGYKNKRG
ncbi:hypothetical protein UFOVP434_77 [uncultured Caudovirales phage]|uniref:Uncharacterized protein n=1 Tax=uncultured Caudovirales phage TaxID=2100421 RepID=A0A6J5MHC8_9CAUD|nr:hypothetical protein UFOVP434_77 [uncultured Caudovirales phage]